MSRQLASERWRRFCHCRRSLISLWILALLFGLSLLAELFANDKPILIRYQQRWYLPLLVDYTESQFGGEFDGHIDYTDPYIQDLLDESGAWQLWPALRMSFDTINYDLPSPAPSPPSRKNWLGTDDKGRDVFVRLIYGFRLSLVFAIFLTACASVIGISVGALLGYYGGRLDLYGLRLIEIWSSMPTLYLLIILSSFVNPNFWWLILIMTLFSWLSLVGVVRAEFLRSRNFLYVRAAQALGVADLRIIFRHVLPNAMVASLTMMPFIISGAIGSLASLDFLGFGLPPESPSLGELVAAGKANLQAPWLGLSAFITLSLLLSLLVFIGEGVRDAFDPYRQNHPGNRR